MTPIQASKKIIVNGKKQTVVQDYALIHKRSRAGKNGKNIMCPICGNIKNTMPYYLHPVKKNTFNRSWFIDYDDVCKQIKRLKLQPQDYTMWYYVK